MRRVTRRENVIDNYHGTKVSDPYRWLETDNDPEVQEWMKEQNGDFEKYIGAFSSKEGFKKRIGDLWNYHRASAPEYVNGVYYTWRHDGVQNQAVLYRMKNLEDVPGEVVLDPNTLSKDGTVAVTMTEFSPKGNYLAYGLSQSGSDRQVKKVLDLRTLKDTGTELKHMKWASVAWLPDESGFYYNRYPASDNAALELNALNSMLCLHMLGTDQSADKLIHKDDDHPEWDFYVQSDEDNKWLFMAVSESTLRVNQLYYRLLSDIDAPWRTISSNFEQGYEVIGVADDTAYIFTQKDAPFGKIISLKLTDEEPDFKTIIEDKGEMLENTALVNNMLAAAYLRHACYRIGLYDLDGGFIRELELPAPGSVVGASGKRDRAEFFVTFNSYLCPAAVLRFDLAAGSCDTWFAPKLDFPFGEYETIQKFYESKDGTKVPLFLTYKKGIALDGTNKTLLYGYGGYNISMTPSFSAGRLAWLEKGGIYAVACIRGGNEYGEAWHRAGMLESKQNCFDDFIAAGEYLIKEGYTSRERLGIQGGSNGGLLTGACLTQRPELFGAVIVAVPVLDMLRYQLFTAGRYWTGEYGSSDNAEQFKFLYKYSPLHNVKMNTVYPPTLVMTADTDDRVVPSQARKFTATLQAADGGDSPILIRIEKAAGHGHGKPISKLVEEQADLYTFLYENLG